MIKQNHFRTKSQINQSFIFIMSMIIMFVIAFVGFKAINSFMEHGRQLKYIQIKQDFQELFDDIKNNYGSERNFINKPYKISSEFNKICFISYKNTDYGNDVPELIKDKIKECFNNNQNNQYNQLDCDYNAFIIGKDSMIVLSLPRLKVCKGQSCDSNNYKTYCSSLNNGYLRFSVENIGKYLTVKLME